MNQFKRGTLESMLSDVVMRISGELEEQLMDIDSKITGVHFIAGHYNDIKRKLQERDKTNTLKYQRYPLVALFKDYPVEPVSGTKGRARVQMIILAHTTKDRYIEDREIQVFEPILRPIYQSLLYHIVDCGHFVMPDQSAVRHQMLERPHWGDPGVHGNTGYILTDVLDGIELRNLELTMY